MTVEKRTGEVLPELSCRRRDGRSLWCDISHHLTHHLPSSIAYHLRQQMITARLLSSRELPQHELKSCEPDSVDLALHF